MHSVVLILLKNDELTLLEWLEEELRNLHYMFLQNLNGKQPHAKSIFHERPCLFSELEILRNHLMFFTKVFFFGLVLR
jgi:hypothetical protein